MTSTEYYAIRNGIRQLFKELYEDDALYVSYQLKSGKHLPFVPFDSIVNNNNYIIYPHDDGTIFLTVDSIDYISV